MVHLITGSEGSGKTKKLLDIIHEALKNESGSMVCIEKGNTMRYDLDHRVRLIDASEYPIGTYAFLQGFLSGLHAGNFDISHIFVDNLYKLSGGSDAAQTEAFLTWCDRFSTENGLSFTMTVPGDSASAPEYLKKYM